WPGRCRRRRLSTPSDGAGRPRPLRSVSCFVKLHRDVTPSKAASHVSDHRSRIMLLSPGFPPARGGIERTAGELAAGLRDSEFELEVVAGTPPQSSVAGMDGPEGGRVHWTANDPPYGRRATAALLRKAITVGARFRPDAVIAMHIRTMPAARALHHAVRS